MQSSTAVLFRASVLLACLVAVPLAAVFGKSLPDLARGLLDGRWPWQSAAAYGSPGEAPRFVPATSADQTTDLSGDRSAPGWPPQQHPASPPGAAAASSSSLPRSSPVVPTSHQAPLRPGSAPLAAPWPSGAAPQSGPEPLGAGPSQRSLPVLGPNPSRTSALAPAAAGPSEPGPQARSTADRFTPIQQRLRALGATYYLLESWGDQGRSYRFYCRVAVAGNPNYTRHFEATGSDPLEAMAQVVREVEAWRAWRQADSGGLHAEDGRPGRPIAPAAVAR